MTAVLQKRPTFYSLIGQGTDIPEKHRKWLELAKDYRLTAFEGATSEQLMAHDLRIHQAMRRAMDVQAAAMRAGVPVGQVLMRQGRPRASAENVVDEDEFDRRHRAGEMQDEMDKRDVLAREKRRSDFMADLSREDLDFPTRYTEAMAKYNANVDEAMASSRNRYGPVEGAMSGAGESLSATVGSMFAGSAVGGTVGGAVGRGTGRAAGMAVDAAGYGATEVVKRAAWAPLSYLGFEMGNRPRRRRQEI